MVTRPGPTPRHFAPPRARFGAFCRTHDRSVARGCPVLAKVIQQVSAAVSRSYQTRPPPVTSICHCSQVCPRWVPWARLPFSL